ncbi:MAG TPA: hypothetical protein VFW69_08605 [Mycobacterium sp.]|nr:hypothetical protein [Mycobacterium sp.]
MQLLPVQLWTRKFNRARSSGVAPNFATRNRNSRAAERSPSQNSACKQPNDVPYDRPGGSPLKPVGPKVPDPNELHIPPARSVGPVTRLRAKETPLKKKY